MRTDVKGYHDSIDRHRMLEMISRHIKDRVVLNYLRQARRCPKSPGPVWLPGKTSDAVPLIGRLLDHLVGSSTDCGRVMPKSLAVLIWFGCGKSMSIAAQWRGANGFELSCSRAAWRTAAEAAAKTGVPSEVVGFGTGAEYRNIEDIRLRLRQVDAMRAVLCARVHMPPGAGGKGLRVRLTRPAGPCISERRNPGAANGRGRSFARTDHTRISSAVCRRSRELRRHRAGQLTRIVAANSHRRPPTFKPARG